MKLINDCCFSKNGMPSIEKDSVDMILCDLPYGVTKNKWDSVIDLEKMWKEYWRVLKKKEQLYYLLVNLLQLLL